MMFQSGQRERPGVRLAIEQKRFVSTKVRYSRTINPFGKMPAGSTAILDQLLLSVMFPNVLQVGRRNLDLFALRHGVNMIIQHAHVSPSEKTGNFSFPPFDFGPPPEGYCISPACERARRKVSVSTPLKIGVKLPKLLGVKIEMRQPVRNFCRICRDRNFTPKDLEIEIGADLRREVTPDNRVGIAPNVKLKRALP